MGAKQKERLAGATGLLPKLPQSTLRAEVAVPRSAAETDSAGAGEYRKTTVTLGLADMQFLDELALRIRQINRVHVNRGEIIRAMIAALRESGLDLSVASSETAIRVAVTARLGA